MSYVIETGVPLPARQRGIASARGARTEWTATLEALDVGQSVLTPDSREYNSAQQFIMKSRPKQFATRKVPGKGWRIWRTA